jgi:hypothetical protein
MQNIFRIDLRCMEPCLEIIYKVLNRASSRREYHPSAELGIAAKAISRADSGNGCTRIPSSAFAPGVRTSVQADQTERVYPCRNLSIVSIAARY